MFHMEVTLYSIEAGWGGAGKLRINKTAYLPYATNAGYYSISSYSLI